MRQHSAAAKEDESEWKLPAVTIINSIGGEGIMVMVYSPVPVCSVYGKFIYRPRMTLNARFNLKCVCCTVCWLIVSI